MKGINVFCLTVLLLNGAAGTARSQDGPATQLQEEKRSGAGLILKTADGRQWTGAPARIQILEPQNSQPELATVSFAVISSEGEQLGAHAELSTADILGTSWEVRLDGQTPTKPGLGVLSHGTTDKPEIAGDGRLTIEVRESGLTGKLETDVDTLKSATFEGPFTVECVVRNEAAQGGVNGSLTSGEALMVDERFESRFCQSFKKLHNLARGQR